MGTLSAAIVATLLFTNSISQPPILPDYGKDPTVNLSAIRLLRCGPSSGTGFLIADNIIATALHVATRGDCLDAKSGKPLVVYHTEPEHDFVLTRVELKGIPYIKYDCGRFVTGQSYSSYGYSSYLQDYNIFRQSNMVAYPYYSGPGWKFPGAAEPMPRLRALYGPMVFGHSGGPVIDTVTGMAKGMNNAGRTTLFGTLVTGHSWSTELADTILCRPRPNEGDTSPSS